MPTSSHALWRRCCAALQIRVTFQRFSPSLSNCAVCGSAAVRRDAFKIDCGLSGYCQPDMPLIGDRQIQSAVLPIQMKRASSPAKRCQLVLARMALNPPGGDDRSQFVGSDAPRSQSKLRSHAGRILVGRYSVKLVAASTPASDRG